MKPRPYEVVVYFSQNPRPVPGGYTVQEAIFGRFAQWSAKETDTCPKKFRITVEAVNDEED
jgi:hypothetical protein